MLYELRIYDCCPGRLPALLESGQHTPRRLQSGRLVAVDSAAQQDQRPRQAVVDDAELALPPELSVQVVAVESRRAVPDHDPFAVRRGGRAAVGIRLMGGQRLGELDCPLPHQRSVAEEPEIVVAPGVQCVPQGLLDLLVVIFVEVGVAGFDLCHRRCVADDRRGSAPRCAWHARCSVR